jgi:hypothetical protein
VKRALLGSIRKASKVGLFVLVIAIAGLALALDGRPASASHTRIVQSFAAPDPQHPGQTICPSPPVVVTSVFGMLGGAPVTLCVWAMNVDDPEGVGGFELGVTYNSTLVTVESFFPQTVWLASTGRSVFCAGVSIDPNAEPGVGFANTACNTINMPPPYGPGCSYTGCPQPPQSTGLIGKVTVRPSQPGLTTLNFASRSFLVDTGKVNGATVISPARIPNSVTNVNFRSAACADYTGDNAVRIPDIMKIVQKYGTNDPLYDLDVNGIVLVPDITIGVQQYGQTCPT